MVVLCRTLGSEGILGHFLKMDARLNRKEWEVHSIPISVARNLVETYHYAHGASNTAVYLHGLFRKGEEKCYGVAWWLPPTKSAAQATYPKNWRGVLSLSRLAIRPETPKNACTFLIGKSVKLIPANVWPCLVTYADLMQEHTGAIYRASNWTYIGLTKPQQAFKIGNRLVAKKAGPHTRTNAEMESLGAVMIGTFAKHKFVIIREPRKPKVLENQWEFVYE